MISDGNFAICDCFHRVCFHFACNYIEYWLVKVMVPCAARESFRMQSPGKELLTTVYEIWM